MIPLTMSEAASDAMSFATESFSNLELRSVTKMTGKLAENVARDIRTVPGVDRIRRMAKYTVTVVVHGTVKDSSRGM